MLLTITTTHDPATDLGYLLAKNPARVHTRKLSFGESHVFFPEATEEICTAALLLDLDPVRLVRGSGRGPKGGERTLAHYVNDRPYVTSSFFSVAIARNFATAMGGRSRERPELAETPIPLEAKIVAVPCRGGEDLLRRLFEPLGYEVTAEQHPLDENYPDWGAGRYFTVTLKATCRVADLLAHLYVLLPALDLEKHYWIGKDEIDKLLAKGEGWLGEHPEREQIVHRYLGRRRHLSREALERLVAEDDPDPDETAEAEAAEEEVLEKRVSLNEQRHVAVLEALQAAGAKRVVDLGCGEGRLLARLAKEKQFERIAGMDASTRALEIAFDRLKLERMLERRRERFNLFQGALTYRDGRLADYDAACLVEVIEHVDPPRLGALEHAVFEFADLDTIVVTTPNVEYNVRFETLPEGKLRHRDHRFEWTRAEFNEWATGVAERHGYELAFQPVGEEDSEVGPPSQMVVFSR